MESSETITKRIHNKKILNEYEEIIGIINLISYSENTVKINDHMILLPNSILEEIKNIANIGSKIKILRLYDDQYYYIIGDEKK